MAVVGAPHLDAVLLAALAAQTPRELQILRLRLRFGLPQSLAVDARFRLALELVDEMGQPVALPDERRRELEARVVVAEAVGASASAGVELQTREVRSAQQERSRSCTWTLDAVIDRQTLQRVASASECRDDPTPLVTLLLQLRRRRGGDAQRIASSSDFHGSFQRFCVHSEWLDAATLALALRTPPLRLTTSASSATATSGCSRAFAVPTSLSSGTATLVEIRENYGDTMGSHVWDASILLAFALCVARSTRVASAGMLELGAGCGLLGVVFSMVSREHDDGRRRALVLTERAESLALLRANLELNGVRTCESELVVAAPLVWGVAIEQELPPVDALFACDVLYNWRAHEALLATVDALLAAQPAAEQAVSVVVAHKHRGEATCAKLEALLRGDSCGSDCGDSCRWVRWSVTRAARLGAVDVLVLTRKRGDADDDAPVS